MTGATGGRAATDSAGVGPAGPAGEAAVGDVLDPGVAVQLLDHLGDAVLVHDRQGRLVAVNEAACETLGHDRASLLRLGVGDIETTAAAAEVAALCDRARGATRPLAHVGVYRHRDGSLVPVDMRTTHMARDGEDLFVTVARDVSDRHRAEAVRREGEERLRAVIEHSPFGVAVIGPDGRPVLVNRRLAALLGRDHADLGTLDFATLYTDPEDLTRLRELFAVRGAVREREVRLRVRDAREGETNRWFLVSWQATKVEERPAVVGWYQDIHHRHQASAEMDDLHAELQFRIEERTRDLGVEITERRYAEAALKEANQFLEQKVEERTKGLRREVEQRRRAEAARERTEMELLEIIEGAPMAVGIADMEGRFLFWNPLFYRLGRQQQEAGGKISFGLEFKDPDLLPALRARLVAGEPVENVEAPLLVGAGDPHWVMLSMRRLTFEGQAALLTWVYDVTDMKQQAEALDEARQAAEQSARAKSAFLAAMSHEIRTPMNGVITMVDLLGQTALDPGQRHMLDVATDSAHALLTIIDEVLDFSKIEAGRVTLETVDLSLSQVIEGVSDLLAPRAEKKGLDVLYQGAPDLPDHVAGDVSRLRQVLVNLLGNAIKFTESGHVILALSRTDPEPEPETDPAGPPGAEDPVWVRCAVTDTGIGLSDAQIGHLFTPFSQADGTTQRRFGGTGLGLSICRSLVEMMGGRIGVDSTPGEGSVFWFEVPLARRPERRDRTPPPLTGARILVAGDGAVARAHLTEILTWAGATVIPAADGDAVKAAMMHALVAETPLDAVILGRHIDHGPGMRLVDDVRRIGGSRPPRVLVLVPRGNAETSRAAERAEVAAVIGWPVHRWETALAVSVALGRTPPDAFSPWARRQSDRRRSVVGHYLAPDRAEAEQAGCVVLVAEDNATNQTVIRMLLDRLGLVADLAGDGVEALDLYHRRRYGLVLTDCHMPDMDGYGLTERIRALEAGGGTRVPIVALTADAIAGTARLCLDRGMDDYLTKPVAIADLEAAVARWLPQAMTARRVRPPGAIVGSGPVTPSGDAPVPAVDPEPPVSAVSGAVLGPVPWAAPKGPVEDDASVTPAGGHDDGGATIPPVLDTTYMRELVGDDAALLHGLLEQFLETTDADLVGLNTLLDEGRAEDARKLAHGIAGAARSAGAMRLAALVGEIETALLVDDVAAARRVQGALRPSFDAVAAAARPR